MPKSIILTKKIQNVQVNDAQDFVKIITFGIYNWNICLSQIKKQIQQLSSRHLSLRGKAILLNSLILSKITFLSNVFSISTMLQQKIESIVFKHIWQFHKTEPIA